MKKRLLMVLTLLVVTFATGILVACDDRNVKQSYIKQDTIETMITMGSNLDTKDAVLVIEYKNGKTKEIASAELKFSQIDTLTVGTKTLRITYKTITAELKIEVVESETTVAVAHGLTSRLLADFEANSALQGQNSKTEFYDREQPLYVGTENTFNFRISATGLDQEGNQALQIGRVRSEIKVELKNEDNTYTLLDGEELEAYLEEVDTTYVTLKFTPAAAGEIFKVSVKALETEEGYSTEATSFDAELTVIEGYNVYNARQLSVFNNRENHEMTNPWNDFKTQFGLEDIKTNTIIMQNTISITKDDVPAEYFWAEGDTNYPEAQARTDQPLEGSLKDFGSYGVYSRTVANGEQFNMIGNYFSIDISEFPKILVEVDAGNHSTIIGGINVAAGEAITSHGTLFFTSPVNATGITEETGAYWKNLRFIGNSTLDDNPLNSGGVIQSKQHAINFKTYNTISNNFYVTYFLEQGHTNEFLGNFELDKVKGYDSFSVLIYAWGAKNVLIKDSEFIGAGGPVIIADHTDASQTNPQAGNATHIDVVNSRLESVVNGGENWFNTYGAGSIVQGLFALDGLLRHPDLAQENKSIVSRQEDELLFANIIVAFKGDSQGLTSKRIRGYMGIFESMEDYNKHYGLNGETKQSMTTGLDLSPDSPILNRIFGSGDGKNLTHIQGNHSQGFIDQNVGGFVGTPFDHGTHLNIYLENGMGVIVQLYDKQ